MLMAAAVHSEHHERAHHDQSEEEQGAEWNAKATAHQQSAENSRSHN